MVARMISETFRSDIFMLKQVAAVCFLANADKFKRKIIQTSQLVTFPRKKEIIWKFLHICNKHSCLENLHEICRESSYRFVQIFSKTFRSSPDDHHCVKSVQIRSFFWSVFSRIWTEYEEILRISPYSVRTQKNTDQKTPRLGTFHPDDYRTKIIMNQEIFQNLFHGVSHQSCLLNRNSCSDFQPSDLQLY